jgi:hypothetical protein
MPWDDTIVRLARQIDAARKSERFLVNAEDVAGLRRRGACELHQFCLEFVSSVNSKLDESPLELSPATYSPGMFRERDVNLIQVSAQGRQLQIVFQATSQVFSTEKFATPYILEGEVRTYNQKMLEQFQIRNQSLFYCLHEDTAAWLLYDWRNPRSTPFGPELLATLMQPLFRK